LAPVSVHAADPVLQAVAPVWQGLPDGVQVVPATQALQTPLPQTRPAPHAVPLVTLLPLSVQVAPPDPQTTVPLRQGFVGAQLPPPSHATQVPPRQSPPLPQAVPSDTLAPVSVQLAAPPAQATAPTWQAFDVGVHTAPAEQVTQAPAAQYCPTAHARPQAPQWIASVATDTHPPPQRVCPAEQVSIGLMLSANAPREVEKPSTTIATRWPAVRVTVTRDVCEVAESSSHPSSVPVHVPLRT